MKNYIRELLFLYFQVFSSVNHCVFLSLVFIIFFNLKNPVFLTGKMNSS